MATDDQIIALNRDIGEIKGSMDAMDRRITGLEMDIERRLGNIEDMLGDVKSVINQQKGGWRVIAVIASALTAMCAGGAWLIDHLR